MSNGACRYIYVWGKLLHVTTCPSNVTTCPSITVIFFSDSVMVRTYKRKTSRGTTSREVFEQASNLVLNGNLSLRDAANSHDINFMTLHRYIKKRNLNPGNDRLAIGYAKPSKVFSDMQEQELGTYVEDCSRIYYGMTTKDLRKFAFQLAVANNNKYPETWKKKRDGVQRLVIWFFEKA